MVQEFRTLVVCLNNAHIIFRYFVKLGESIFSALVESGHFFFVVEVVDTNYQRHGYRLRLVVVHMD